MRVPSRYARATVCGGRPHPNHWNGRRSIDSRCGVVRVGASSRPRSGALDRVNVAAHDMQKLGFAVVPRAADFIRPNVISAPAVNGAIDRAALARRLRGDTRQPFTVRVPTVLFVIGGLLTRCVPAIEHSIHVTSRPWRNELQSASDVPNLGDPRCVKHLGAGTAFPTHMRRDICMECRHHRV